MAIPHFIFFSIHGRELEGCIANDDKLLERALQNLAPGGYLELQASSARLISVYGTHGKAENINFYVNTMFEGAAQFGKPLDVAPKRRKFEDRGFIDVQEKLLKVCIPLTRLPYILCLSNIMMTK